MTTTDTDAEKLPEAVVAWAKTEWTRGHSHPEVLKLLERHWNTAFADLQSKLAEAEAIEESAHAVLSAFPLDVGDWPIEAGEAAVAALRRWYENEESLEDWGDDIQAETIVGMLWEQREAAAKAEATATELREALGDAKRALRSERARHGRQMCAYRLALAKATEAIRDPQNSFVSGQTLAEWDALSTSATEDAKEGGE